MENKKKLISIILIVILALAAIAEISFIFWQFSKINSLEKELARTKIELDSTKKSLSSLEDKLNQKETEIEENSTEIKIIKIAEYKSEKSGISFEYPKEAKDEEVLFSEKDNETLMFIQSEEESPLLVKSLNFNLKKDEKINDAILRIFSNGNENCSVTKKDGILNKIDYDIDNLDGDYELTSNLGKADKVGCGEYSSSSSAHFIYNEKFPNKIIFVKYGNYTFLSGFYADGSLFSDWLTSIKYYK